jgi:hypothetical protein
MQSLIWPRTNYLDDFPGARFAVEHIKLNIRKRIDDQPSRHSLVQNIFLCLLFVGAQANATQSEVGGWLIFSTGDAFSSESGPSRWQYSFDTQARYFDFGSGVNQYLLRPAVGHRFGETARAWFGYARFRTRNAAGNEATEDRFWQQLDWRAGQWNDGTLTMRARLEQRSVSVGDDVGLVFRFMTRYTRPLGNNGKTNLIVAIEPFVELRDTDWSGSSGLGQNRVSIGIGWKVNDSWTIETGYMNQYIWRDNADDLMNHLAIVNFRFAR